MSREAAAVMYSPLETQKESLVKKYIRIILVVAAYW
jgi:hypothetical protein